jgi:hypothetical protein
MSLKEAVFKPEGYPVRPEVFIFSAQPETVYASLKKLCQEMTSGGHRSCGSSSVQFAFLRRFNLPEQGRRSSPNRMPEAF